MSETIIDAEASYAEAYWAYLRGETQELPDESDHGITMTMAERVRIQCDIDFVAKKARE